jgi:hypothetical protein
MWPIIYFGELWRNCSIAFSAYLQYRIRKKICSWIQELIISHRQATSPFKTLFYFVKKAQGSQSASAPTSRVYPVHSGNKSTRCTAHLLYRARRLSQQSLWRILIFWHVTPYNLVDIYQLCKGIFLRFASCCLYTIISTFIHRQHNKNLLYIWSVAPEDDPLWLKHVLKNKYIVVALTVNTCTNKFRRNLPHLQLWRYLLKTDAEMSVNFCQTTRCHIPVLIPIFTAARTSNLTF